MLHLARNHQCGCHLLKSIDLKGMRAIRIFHLRISPSQGALVERGHTHLVSEALVERGHTHSVIKGTVFIEKISVGEN